MKTHSPKSNPLRGIIIVALVFIIGSKVIDLPHAAQEAFSHSSGAASQPTPPSIIFTCPDGRTGLHLVHTRFLVGQSKASNLFVASRLHLMRTFLIPSLNAQTTKNWVYYASHDPDLKPAALHALKDAVSSIQAANTLTLKQPVPKDGNWGNLNFSAATAELAKYDPKVKEVDLFITSRIDNDDATHYDTIASFQDYACGGKPGSGGKQAVRVAYPSPGQLWFPSAKEQYGLSGIWKTGKGADDLYRVMSIMPTMILAGKEFIKRCSGKINVYSMRHYQPEDLETLKIEGCKYRFSARKDILYWTPPKGEVAYLYVRTPASWTSDKEDLKYKEKSADFRELEHSLGISPAALAATNLLFSGFQKEAPELLEGKPSTNIE